MKIRGSLVASVILVGLVTVALAVGTAADLLKSVSEFRMSLVQQAQAKNKADGTKIDFASIQKQVQTKAEEAVKGKEAAKVEPSEGLEWAQLFSMADRPQDAQVALTRFIDSKPDGPRLYQAQAMLLGMASRAQDFKTVATTLQNMKPYNAASSLAYASYAAGYANRTVGELGVDGAIGIIDKALGSVDQKSLSEPERKRFDSIQTAALQSKVGIYKDAGQKDKALGLLDAAMKAAPDAAKGRFAILKNQLTLVGSAAPGLTIERGYGKFPGLEALKGKVVVLDFFAHWCGPCKAAFPAMRDMFAELQPKGLEVVGVTTYYGYLGDPQKKLTPDEEYAKMADFVKDQKMTWPVVFGPRSNFNAYGVTAIPHVVVIGRDGAVHNLDIGYSPELFAKFRKEVEALLAEK